MRLTILPFLVMNILTLSGQVPETEDRNLAEFTSVAVSSGIDVILSQDSTYKVTVEGSKSDIHRIITEVKDSTLRIYCNGRFRWKYGQIKTVHVISPVYRKITSKNGSDVKSEGLINGDTLILNTSGGSDIYLTTCTNSIFLVTRSGGNIELLGTTNDLAAKVSEGSLLDAKKMIAKNVNVFVTGGANARIYATDVLNAKTNGSGDILYKGSPNELTINRGGSGEVKRF